MRRTIALMLVCWAPCVFAGRVVPRATAEDVAGVREKQQAAALQADNGNWATNLLGAAYYPTFTNFDQIVNTQITAAVDTVVTNESAATINAHANALTNFAAVQAWAKVNDQRWQAWRDYEIQRRKDERDQFQFLTRICKKVVRWFSRTLGE